MRREVIDGAMVETVRTASPPAVDPDVTVNVQRGRRDILAGFNNPVIHEEMVRRIGQEHVERVRHPPRRTGDRLLADHAPLGWRPVTRRSSRRPADRITLPGPHNVRQRLRTGLLSAQTGGTQGHEQSHRFSHEHHLKDRP